MSPRRPRDKQQTIHDILVAAQRLFSEKGLHGTSIRDIEVASGVSKGLILHHFESKESLYAAVQERLMKAYFEEMKLIRQRAKDLKDLIGAAVRGSFTLTKNNREYRRISLWAYLEGQSPDPALEVGFTQNLVDTMRFGQEAGLVREDIDAAVMPFIIKGAIEYWLRKKELIKRINADPGEDSQFYDKLDPPSDDLLIEALTKLFVK